MKTDSYHVEFNETDKSFHPIKVYSISQILNVFFLLPNWWHYLIDKFLEHLAWMMIVQQQNTLSMLHIILPNINRYLHLNFNIIHYQTGVNVDTQINVNDSNYEKTQKSHEHLYWSLSHLYVDLFMSLCETVGKWSLPAMQIPFSSLLWK